MIKSCYSSVLIIVVYCKITSLAFVTSPALNIQSSRQSSPHAHTTLLVLRRKTARVPSRLLLAEKGNRDGMREGRVILVLALFICTWLFTIPPEFRRAYICPLEIYCRDDQSLCADCTTWGQWFNGVAEYYQGGGRSKLGFFNWSQDAARESTKIWPHDAITWSTEFLNGIILSKIQPDLFNNQLSNLSP